MKGGSMFALALVAICVVGTAVGQIAMKSGMNQIGEIGSLGQLFNLGTLLSIISNPRVIIGICCYGISFILWLGAMSTLNISFMYPLMSLAYVITAIVAFVFLKEHISLVHWMGIILVVAGCFLISRTAA
jgi:drug/metabolite transporter (DMT)-like permease